MDRDDILGGLAIWAFCVVLAFFADEPKGCTNVWNSLQHKVMGKECPK